MERRGDRRDGFRAIGRLDLMSDDFDLSELAIVTSLRSRLRNCCVNSISQQRDHSSVFAFFLWDGLQVHHNVREICYPTTTRPSHSFIRVLRPTSIRLGWMVKLNRPRYRIIIVLRSMVVLKDVSDGHTIMRSEHHQTFDTQNCDTG